MKMKTILTETLVAGMFFLPMAFANVDIKAAMNSISQNYSSLGRQIDDPNMNASSKQIIDSMISSSRQAATETPTRADNIKDPAKGKVIQNYRTEMQDLIAKLEDMKVRLDSQDNKGAREIYNGLKQWTKPEHSKPYK